MRKWIIAYACIICCLIVVQVQEANASSFREVKEVNLSTLTLKQYPDLEADTLAYLARHTLVTVYSMDEEWAYVKADGKEGYVKSAYLQDTASVVKIASSKGGLVVKESPDPTANTSAVLTYNMIVEDFGPVTDSYSFVQYGNITGYVATAFIGTPQTEAKVVNKDGLEIRNIASQSGEVTGTLSKNTQVLVHSTLMGWAYVTADNQRGYVEAKHLIVQKGLITSDYFRFANFKSLSYASTSGASTYNLSNEQIVKVSGIGYGLRTENNTFILDNFGTPEIILNLPLKHGDTWKNNKESYAARVLSTYKVKAGTFKNVLEITLTTYGVATKYYFAPQLGIIKIAVEAYNFELAKVNS